MSRLLFLTPQLPHPPHQGAAIRNLNLIKLAAQRHEVRVYSFVRSAAEAAAVEVLRQWAVEVRTFSAPRRGLIERAAWAAFSLSPDMARRLRSSELAVATAEACADVIQAEGIEMAAYLRAALGAPTVLDCHNAEWLLQRRTCLLDWQRRKLPGAAYSLLQWLKLRRYERQACLQASAVCAVSEEDGRALRELSPRIRIDVVPNGVDAAFFDPALSRQELSLSPKVMDEDARFLFTGTLDFRPNVDAVRWLAADIWPLIRKGLPAAELTLAGRAPLPDIRRLHGRSGIRVIDSPADIRPSFAAASVYLVPVRAGGGSRYKLLQAMSMELGIVSTPLGAEGLAVADGEHLRLANDPASFAAAAVDLARHPAQRGRLGTAARHMVLERYDWPVLAPRLWGVYERLLGGGASGPPDRHESRADCAAVSPAQPSEAASRPGFPL